MGKYEDAIARYKQWERDHTNGYVIDDMMGFIFPELKESNDEKIRKAIINRTKNLGADDLLYWDGFTVGDVIDWLGKQKEPTIHHCAGLKGTLPLGTKTSWHDDHKETNRKWSEEDELALKSILVSGKYILSQINKDWLKSLPERFNLQPKQEWSEEDEIHKLHTIQLIEDVMDWAEKDGMHNLCVAQCQEALAWLKSLSPQPKAELTLLDQNIINAAIAFVEQNDHFNCWGGIDKQFVIKALRSLKPHWKPSEEQMRDLEYAAKSYSVTCPNLLSLYHELQKLNSHDERRMSVSELPNHP